MKLLDDHVIITNISNLVGLTSSLYATVISVFILRALHILHYYIFVLLNLPHSRLFSRFLSILKFLWTNGQYKPFLLFFEIKEQTFSAYINSVQWSIDFFICRYFLTIKKFCRVLLSKRL